MTFIVTLLASFCAFAATEKDWTEVRSKLVAKGQVTILKNKTDETLFVVSEDHSSIKEPTLAMRAYCESSLKKVETISHSFDVKNAVCEYKVKKTNVNHLAFYKGDKIVVVTFEAKSKKAAKTSKELMLLINEGKLL